MVPHSVAERLIQGSNLRLLRIAPGIEARMPLSRDAVGLMLAEFRQANGDVAGASDVVILDLHTGVGPFAEPTFVCLQEGSALAAARRRFGNDLLAPMEQAPGRVLHPVVGHPTEGYERLFPAAAVVSVVLEMGTCPPDETLPVLIEEHRLTRAGLADTRAG